LSRHPECNNVNAIECSSLAKITEQHMVKILELTVVFSSEIVYGL